MTLKLLFHKDIPNYCSVIGLYREARGRERKSAEQANTVLLYCGGGGRRRRDMKEEERRKQNRRGVAGET